jgi:hypothetical protein
MVRNFTSSHRRSLAAVAALVASCTVDAMPTSPAAETAPLYPVFELRSAPLEPLESFLGRAGGQLRAFTDSTSFEACGVIAQADDGCAFGLIAKTNRSHAVCVSRAVNVPAGLAAVVVNGKSVTIHTHPRSRTIRLSDTDLLLTGRERTGAAQIMRQDPDNFSSDDYATGPGYLATADGVLFQSGAGTQHLFTTYDRPAHASVCAVAAAAEVRP